MIDNKYYTPTIEEFHVGFEYEFTNGDRWEESEMTIQDYKSTGPDYERQDSWFEEELLGEIRTIRVKYLDQEDIESLGWNYTGRGVDLWFSKEGIFFAVSGGHKFTEYKLQYGLHDNRLKIEAFFGGESEGVLFEGIIKNKSELKRLMKQLGIYE